MGYAIYDCGRPYIWRIWDSKREAERELDDLLRYYPKNDPWRKRLALRKVAGSEKEGQEEAQSQEGGAEEERYVKALRLRRAMKPR